MLWWPNIFARYLPSADVASSRIRMSGFRSIARAIAILYYTKQFMF